MWPIICVWSTFLPVIPYALLHTEYSSGKHPQWLLYHSQLEVETHLTAFFIVSVDTYLFFHC